MYIDLRNAKNLGRRYLASPRNDPGDPDARKDAIQALNIIVAGTPNKDKTVFQSGQNKFFRFPRDKSTYDKYDLGKCLLAVRGYYSSIRTATGRILLNLNSQCSPFYPESNLFTLMKRFGLQDPSLEAFIQKLRVRTEYMKTSGGKTIVRVKTIKGFSHVRRQDRYPGGKPKFDKDEPKMIGNASIELGNCDTIKFTYSDKEISVTRYFQEKYNIQLEESTTYVVNCGTDDKPTWIPPELCTVMPGQPYRGKLSEEQTAAMILIAARP